MQIHLGQHHVALLGLLELVSRRGLVYIPRAEYTEI